MRGKRIIMIPGGPVHPLKRTIDWSKPKVRLDGTPDPTCITCQKKKQHQTT